MLRTEHSECEDSSSPQAREACAAIRASILAEEARLRVAHPLLAHQDALALGTWALCLLVMAGTSAAYLRGQLPWYIPFFSNALAASFLHELEHDLIHSLYFVSQPLVTHAMFALIWVAKLSLNPWTRRSYHLHHHRRSGQVDDVEERLLGLGAGNLGFLRLAVALVPALAVQQAKSSPTSSSYTRASFSTQLARQPSARTRASKLPVPPPAAGTGCKRAEAAEAAAAEHDAAAGGGGARGAGAPFDCCCCCCCCCCS
jgi:fatty acid desaturase